MAYLCEPCDHRWYQHRHPDPLMRFLGKVMMSVGAFHFAIGLLTLTGAVR
jgi:hypothetical protein